MERVEFKLGSLNLNYVINLNKINISVNLNA